VVDRKGGLVRSGPTSPGPCVCLPLPWVYRPLQSPWPPHACHTRALSVSLTPSLQFVPFCMLIRFPGCEMAFSQRSSLKYVPCVGPGVIDWSLRANLRLALSCTQCTVIAQPLTPVPHEEFSLMLHWFALSLCPDRYHMGVHTNERPFRCLVVPGCSACFPTAAALNAHVANHIGGSRARRAKLAAAARAMAGEGGEGGGQGGRGGRGGGGSTGSGGDSAGAGDEDEYEGEGEGDDEDHGGYDWGPEAGGGYGGYDGYYGSGGGSGGTGV
jgi:hypothetical protein